MNWVFVLGITTFTLFVQRLELKVQTSYYMDRYVCSCQKNLHYCCILLCVLNRKVTLISKIKYDYFVIINEET